LSEASSREITGYTSNPTALNPKTLSLSPITPTLRICPQPLTNNFMGNAIDFPGEYQPYIPDLCLLVKQPGNNRLHTHGDISALFYKAHQIFIQNLFHARDPFIVFESL